MSDLRPAPTPIVATEFEPPNARRQRRRRLRPWQILVTVVLLAAALLLLFLFTARSIRFVAEVDGADLRVDVLTLMKMQIGTAWLLQPGEYPIRANADGYRELRTRITVTDAQSQRLPLTLLPLPGIVELHTDAAGAQLWIDEVPMAAAREPVDVDAGRHQIRVLAPRYQPYESALVVRGRRLRQTVEVVLQPAWGEFYFEAEPASATVHIDGQPVGKTPGPIEILQGEHQVMIASEGYQPWRRTVRVRPLEERTFAAIRLQPATAQVTVVSQPSQASVSADGLYQGQTPVTIALTPGRKHQLELTRSGYHQWRREIEVRTGPVQQINARLQVHTGRIDITAHPEDALLYVNGRLLGRANRTIELPTERHNLEVRAPGRVPWSGAVTPRPGFPQELQVRLLTPAEARVAAISKEITSPVGQSLVLINPAPITLGASRREPGRRANETLREVNLTRPWYLSRHEVTNSQFRRFQPAHDSGTYEAYDLNEDDQPVVNISWEQAADFCNWLSTQAGLQPAYGPFSANGRSFHSQANGYRLPTEAEWAFAARSTPAGLLKFPWGSARRPADRQGNYADRSAINIVGRVIFGYTDGYPVSTIPGSFADNRLGLADMGGNVAEWVHDFYGIPPATPTTDPLGPASGEFHSIRGSSWMHGSISELRFSYRDYGRDGRPDLGFRVALPLDIPDFESAADAAGSAILDPPTR